MALFVVYGFDTAGTFGEETVDASRQAPRGVLVGDLALGPRRRGLPARGHPRDPGHGRGDRRRPGARVPDRDDDQGDLTYALGGITLGDVYLFVILARGLRLHPGDPGRDDAADVLDGPRPAVCRSAAHLGPRQQHVQDAGQRRDRRRRPRRDPVPRDRRRRRRSTSRSRRTGLIYLSYFLCNIGVLVARIRGWPHKPALVQPRQLGHARQHPRAHLGRPDDHQHRASGRTRPVRRLRRRRSATVTNPTIDTFIKPFGNTISGPAGLADLRDARRCVLIVVGVDLLRRRRSAAGRDATSRPTSRPARR